MRAMLVSRIAIAMEDGQSSSDSARSGLNWLKARFGMGKAGVIAIDRYGVMTAPFDTAGMGRAWLTEKMASPMVAVWPEEPSP
jgi:isoaspartyl peptidase/L-asparaginase-like protein (Ntn-hydrolase superfamily)